MSEIIKNQNKMIEFIKDAVSSVEGEEFSVRRINIYHPWYTLFGDNYLTDSIYVIGNQTMMDHLKETEKDLFGLSREEKEEGVYRFQGKAKWFDINEQGFKSVVLKFRRFHEESGEDYYQFKSLTNLKKRYPYLVGIVDALNNATADNNQTNTLITELSKIIEENKPKDPMFRPEKQVSSEDEQGPKEK